MKLVYINTGVNSVFDSQVLALLDFYSKTDAFDEIILLFGYKNETDIQWLEKKDTSNFKVRYFKLFPNYSFYNKLNENSLLREMKKLDEDFDNYFFHIRTELAGFYFSKLTKKLGIGKSQYLIDIRGASIEEVKEFYGTNKVLKRFKVLNYKNALKILRNGTHVSAVSRSLKDYLIEKNVVTANQVTIHPCLVNAQFIYAAEKRGIIRKKLGLEDEAILIVFASGGNAKWQKNEMILRLAEMNFKVLNLSKISIDHTNIINKFVPYKKVSGYLSAADAAFIWRDYSAVNKVASPVKVSEYISCGLPIIHNGAVKQIEENLVNGRESLMIKSVDELDFKGVKKLTLNCNRTELSKKGKELFGVENIANSYMSLYKRLLSQIKG